MRTSPENILERIIQHKVLEVQSRKAHSPVSLLERSAYFERKPLSLSAFISRKDKSGIIAEFKRKSPSKGVINAAAQVEDVTAGYREAGASGLSVLTDSEFFGGSSEDLQKAREHNDIPILRKDFIVDEYQIVEAKSIGADVILLIAAALEPSVLRKFADVAHTLGMQVLLEVHNKEELLLNLNSGADLIGVNNRNLKTFELSLDVSRSLACIIPKEIIKVSESGIESPETILELRELGYEGFLMGQNFMQHARPGEACQEFIRQLKQSSRN